MTELYDDAVLAYATWYCPPDVDPILDSHLESTLLNPLEDPTWLGVISREIANRFASPQITSTPVLQWLLGTYCSIF